MTERSMEGIYRGKPVAVPPRKEQCRCVWDQGQTRPLPDRVLWRQLEQHVADIMFDASAELEMGCQLCQQAALLGLWDRFDDGEGWLD